MTESMERTRVSRRSFIGGVGVTAGGLMVASGPVFWEQAAKADLVVLALPFVRVPELVDVVPDWSGRIVVEQRRRVASLGFFTTNS